MTPTLAQASSRCHALLLCLLALAPAQAAEIRDRITASQMVRRQASTEWKTHAEGGTARDPRAKSPSRQSIINQSVILCDGSYWTLVPRGSVLHVPATLRARVVKQPAGKLLNWQQFLGRNRSWLSTENVDIATAAGRAAIAEEAESEWVRRGSVVVAVHRGGAISVKRPDPAAKPEKS